MIVGYKLGQKKTIDELANLDAEDESLARWKASLGIVPGAAAAAAGPKVSIVPGSQGRIASSNE